MSRALEETFDTLDSDKWRKFCNLKLKENGPKGCRLLGDGVHC
jgi:hypothetical protein